MIRASVPCAENGYQGSARQLNLLQYNKNGISCACIIRTESWISLVRGSLANQKVACYYRSGIFRS